MPTSPWWVTTTTTKAFLPIWRPVGSISKARQQRSQPNPRLHRRLRWRRRHRQRHPPAAMTASLKKKTTDREQQLPDTTGRSMPWVLTLRGRALAPTLVAPLLTWNPLALLFTKCFGGATDCSARRKRGWRDCLGPFLSTVGRRPCSGCLLELSGRRRDQQKEVSETGRRYDRSSMYGSTSTTKFVYEVTHTARRS